MKGSPVLEKLSTREMVALGDKPRHPRQSVDVASLPAGTLLHLTTKGGGEYLFEVSGCGAAAHVARIKRSYRKQPLGYRDMRQVDPTIKVGVPVSHGSKKTSPVVRLAIIEPGA